MPLDKHQLMPAVHTVQTKIHCVFRVIIKSNHPLKYSPSITKYREQTRGPKPKITTIVYLAGSAQATNGGTGLLGINNTI